MKVKLVALTESKIEEKKLTAEEIIVYIARVSNPSNQLNTETSDKLIKYLIAHSHWSPFEHVLMSVEIVTSRAIAAQILRHRSFTFQEFSMRYSEATELEPIKLRKQAVKNRQSSEEEFNPIVREFPEELFDTGYAPAQKITAEERVKVVMDLCQTVYSELITAGVAKECARMVLPLTTKTTLYMSGTIRSWIHYLEQRTSEHTQLEHREIANEIKKIFIEHFPNISKALNY